MILLCVGFTMVDVMGCVKVWGLAAYSVSVGGISTFLGVLLLALSKSYAFWVMF